MLDSVLNRPSDRYEPKSFLNGLLFPQKKRYFPQIALKTDRCFNNNYVVNPNITQDGVHVRCLGSEKRHKDLQKSFMETEVPHGGSWFKRNQIPNLTTMDINFKPVQT